MFVKYFLIPFPFHCPNTALLPAHPKIHFYKGNYFYDFMIDLLIMSLLKRGPLRNFNLFFFSEGRQNLLIELPPLKVYLFPLMQMHNPFNPYCLQYKYIIETKPVCSFCKYELSKKKKQIPSAIKDLVILCLNLGFKINILVA